MITGTQNPYGAYIECTEQRDNHTRKIQGCCIYTYRIKHHCHLPFGADKESCAATQYPT